MKNIKPLILSEIVEDLKDVKAGVMINFQSLSSQEIDMLRDSLAKKNISMKVYKNSFFKIALKELNLGTDPEPAVNLEKMFNLPTAVIFSEMYPEPVEAAKAFSEWQKAQQKQDISIKGAFYGEKLIAGSNVKKYIDLPSREALIAQVVGGIAAPLTSFVGVLNALLRDLVLVIKGIQDKKEQEA